jgi:hypothetical protein
MVSKFNVTPRTCDLLLLLGLDFLESRSYLSDPLKDYKTDPNKLANLSKTLVGLDRPLRRSDIQKDYLPRLIGSGVVRPYPLISSQLEGCFSYIKRFELQKLNSVKALIVGLLFTKPRGMTERDIRSFLGASYDSHGNWVSRELEVLTSMSIQTPLSTFGVEVALKKGQYIYSLSDSAFYDDSDVLDFSSFLENHPVLPETPSNQITNTGFTTDVTTGDIQIELPPKLSISLNGILLTFDFPLGSKLNISKSGI